MSKRNHHDYESILQKNLEEQNEIKIDVLLQNVNELKQIGLDLNGDISEEKPILNTMSNSFDQVSIYLRKTMNKIDLLMISHTSKIVLFVIVVVLIFLIIAHFWNKA